MGNILRGTIEDVLKDVHIESGRTDQWNEVVSNLEEAISRKVWRHKIDHYSETDKPWNA